MNLTMNDGSTQERPFYSIENIEIFTITIGIKKSITEILMIWNRDFQSKPNTQMGHRISSELANDHPLILGVLRWPFRKFQSRGILHETTVNKIEFQIWILGNSEISNTK